MTRERFEALAEAYGADIRRWPAAEREMAALLAAAEPGFCRAVLARSEELDMALDAWRPMPASHDLRERVIAQAPRERRGFGLAWIWKAGLGAGLAAACAAGLALGVAISDQVSTTPAGAEAVSAALDYDALSSVAGDA
jgi:hypothetical protein